jgi:hypothetical protein
MRTKLYWSKEMTPDGNSDPQEEMKTTRRVNIRTTNTKDIYSLTFLLLSFQKGIKLHKIIITTMFC